MRKPRVKHGARAGFALVTVMVVIALSLLVLAATVNRTLTNARMNTRSNQYNVTCNAAEAAVEKVVARMRYDFQSYGLGGVYANLSIYQNSIPNEDSYWTNFVFTDGNGHTNQTYITMLTNNYTGTLPSQYPGLSTTLAPIYRIISNARSRPEAWSRARRRRTCCWRWCRLPNTRSFTTDSWSSAPAPP